MSLATSLYDALTGINIPKDQARDVVEALEHKMTAEFATKSDIALLRADIASVRKDLSAEIDSVRKHLTAEIEYLRKDLTAAIESVRKDMTAAIESVRKDMTAANDSLRKDLMAEIAALRAEMKALEDRLFKKLAALMVTLMGLMFAALTWVGGYPLLAGSGGFLVTPARLARRSSTGAGCGFPTGGLGFGCIHRSIHRSSPTQYLISWCTLIR